MQKQRFILGAMVLLALVAGCGGAKYVEEKAMLSGVTKAMEAFNSGVSSVETPDALAGILGTFTAQLEKFAPQMKALAQNHPGWESEPPKELADTFAQFKDARTAFENAMPKVMQFASEHGDNEMLRSALQKFQGVVSQM